MEGALGQLQRQVPLGRGGLQDVQQRAGGRDRCLQEPVIDVEPMADVRPVLGEARVVGDNVLDDRDDYTERWVPVGIPLQKAAVDVERMPAAADGVLEAHLEPEAPPHSRHRHGEFRSRRGRREEGVRPAYLPEGVLDVQAEEGTVRVYGRRGPDLSDLLRRAGRAARAKLPLPDRDVDLHTGAQHAGAQGELEQGLTLDDGAYGLAERVLIERARQRTSPQLCKPWADRA